MDVTPKQVEECVDHTGMGFMFARSFNPCRKNASVVRNELGFRTIFNILGPISNPSNAKGQLIGVFDPYMTNTLATAMLTMGVQKGIVVCCNGIDEFTTIGENKVSEIKDGKVIDYMVTPDCLLYTSKKNRKFLYCHRYLNQSVLGSVVFLRK